LQWIDWSRALDVLAAIHPGEVSDVVETDFGFHVFLRRSPPPAASVSGERLVIGYDEAPWLHRFLARAPVAKRSRDEAWALALRIHAELETQPQQFERWVALASDHQDAIRGGDLGSWSTREPSPYPSAIEVLSELEVGQVSAPFDTGVGVQIVRRTAERPRRHYGAEMILSPFDPAQPDVDPASGASTLRRLEEAARVLETHPERFDDIAVEHGGKIIRHWSEGRDFGIAERALDSLDVGEIAPSPIRLNPSRYALLRRAADAPAPKVEVMLDLPAPAHPELSYLFGRAATAQLLAQVAVDARSVLALDAHELAQLEVIHRGDPSDARGSRKQALQHLEAGLPKLLGAERYAAYRALLAHRLEQAILERGLP
jgi:hypothetical protein